MVPHTIKVCGECFRELNSDVEKESSRDDNEEEEDMDGELQHLCGGTKINSPRDATTSWDEEALEAKEDCNLDI